MVADAEESAKRILPTPGMMLPALPASMPSRWTASAQSWRR